MLNLTAEAEFSELQVKEQTFRVETNPALAPFQRLTPASANKAFCGGLAN